MEVVVELFQSRPQNAGGRAPKEMVDFVVSQAASEKPEFAVRRPLAQILAHFLKRSQLLFHELRCVSLAANCGPKQLHASVLDSVDIVRERVRTCATRPPNLILLH